MPIKKSAKKHMRSTSRKRSFNKATKETAKNAIRKTTDLILENKKEEASQAFKKAQEALDKAVKKGTIKKNTAARKKSRLSKKIKAIK